MTRAERLDAEFTRLRIKFGLKGLTKEVIVREARDKRSPLHREFIWNDKAAAQKQRLQRAGELLTQYITVEIIERHEQVRIPLYVRDGSLPARAPGYISTREAMTKAQGDRMLTMELERIRGCIFRARNLIEFVDVQFPGLTERFELLLDGLTDIQNSFLRTPPPPSSAGPSPPGSPPPSGRRRRARSRGRGAGTTPKRGRPPKKGGISDDRDRKGRRG